MALVGTLGLAALVDPRRAAFSRSPAPWVAIAVGVLVLAPHLWWLLEHRFPTFSYAAVRTSSGLAGNLADTASYVARCIGYVTVPLIVSYLLLRPSSAALREVAWPNDQMAADAVHPIVADLAAGAVRAGDDVRIVPLWSMPAWTLLPIVLLASPLIVVGRDAVRKIVAGVTLFTLAMLAAAPSMGRPPIFAQSRPIASNTPRCWRKRSSSNGAAEATRQFR